MRKAAKRNSTSRRSPAPIADPIFAAIAAHREAAATFQIVIEALTLEGEAAGPAGPCPDVRPLDAACKARYYAAQALIETAPTTHAGLRALENHLRDDRHSLARGFIRLPVIDDDGRFIQQCGYPEAVDWFIAQRASEIAGWVPPRALSMDELLSAIRAESARYRERQKAA
jgi:hypothetical protein